MLPYIGWQQYSFIEEKIMQTPVIIVLKVSSPGYEMMDMLKGDKIRITIGTQTITIPRIKAKDFGDSIKRVAEGEEVSIKTYTECEELIH